MDRAPRWHCAQIGAREHYAVPRALAGASALDCVYTDFWANGVSSLLARGRFHRELANANVTSWNMRALWWEIGLRYLWNGEPPGQGGYRYFIEVGKRFANCVRDKLRKRSDLGPESIFFAYDTGALEIFEYLR